MRNPVQAISPNRVSITAGRNPPAGPSFLVALSNSMISGSR
jgi:hypothetical protein